MSAPRTLGFEVAPMSSSPFRVYPFMTEFRESEKDTLSTLTIDLISSLDGFGAAEATCDASRVMVNR